MVALALFVGLDPNDLKLITAVFVFFTLIASGLLGFKKFKFSFANSFIYKKRKLLVIIAVAAAIIICGYFFVFNTITQKSETKMVKIGVIIPNDATILTLTKDGFYREMEKLGYENGVNCKIIEQNANGDIPTVVQ